MQTVTVIREPPLPSTFAVEDVVEIMGCEVGEEEKLIVHGKVINVNGKTLHGIPIYVGYVFMEEH